MKWKVRVLKILNIPSRFTEFTSKILKIYIQNLIGCKINV